jgi:FkbM family methyltransferase
MNFNHELRDTLNKYRNSSKEQDSSYSKLGRKRQVPRTFFNKAKLALREFLFCSRFLNLPTLEICLMIPKHKLQSFSYLYRSLNDPYSKELLLKVLALRLIGDRVKLMPVEYWLKLDEALKTIKQSSNSKVHHLNKFAFKKDNIEIEIWGTIYSVFNQFFVNQYTFDRNGTKIDVQDDDCVIEAGGCWGESALYFARKMSSSGKVYSFEFVKSNLEVLFDNIELNKKFKENIEVVQRPLWSSTGVEFYYRDAGDSSKISFTGNGDFKEKVISISIDDFVEDRGLDRLDFLKLDVEGAELAILKGAIKTIKRFKPKLAIALYHKEPDFFEIPGFINNLNLGYELYVDHYTFYHEETFLFAK